MLHWRQMDSCHRHHLWCLHHCHLDLKNVSNVHNSSWQNNYAYSSVTEIMSIYSLCINFGFILSRNKMLKCKQDLICAQSAQNSSNQLKCLLKKIISFHYRKQPYITCICALSAPLFWLPKISAVFKVERDIIISITVSPIVIIYVKTFKTSQWVQ